MVVTIDCKTCCICKESKPADSFAKHSKRKDGLQSSCRECQAERHKKYYEKNKNKYRKKNKKLLKRNQEWAFNYLSSHPCIDCGETNPVVLQFDHQRDKTNNVSTMIHHMVSIETLETEVDKCEVRCANCHAIKTAKEFGFYNYRMGLMV